MEKKVCILGMGFVGLTLGVVCAEKGHRVAGIERNPVVAEQLRNNSTHFFEAGLSDRMAAVNGSRLFFHEDIPDEAFDVFIISVGTPIDKKTNLPIMDQIEQAAIQVATRGRGGLVILRSTVPVGVTRSVVKRILEKSGKDFQIAFCPERTIEGNALAELTQLPQLIGADDARAGDASEAFFRTITPDTVRLSSLEGAELGKLLSNAWRDVTFGFSNEISAYCERVGLDAHEVISATNYKYSRASIPSPGFSTQKIPLGGFVGGFCLRKDPFILLHSSAQVNVLLPMVSDARQANGNLPARSVERIMSHLPDTKSRIFILGFAYKGEPPTDDMRDSPTIEIVSEFRKRGYENLVGHDFLVKPDKMAALGVRPVSLEEGFKGAQAVVFCTNAKKYREIPIDALVSAMSSPCVVFDSWRLFDHRLPAFRQGVYLSVGFSGQKPGDVV